MRNDNKAIEYDNLFFAVCLAFTSILNFLYRSLLFFAGTTFKMDVILSYGLLLFAFVKAFPHIIRAINKVDVILVLFFSIALCVSMFSSYSDTFIVKTEISKIIRQCLILYIGAKVAFISPKLIVYLRVAAYITIIRVVADVFLFNTAGNAFGYSQYEGYMFLNGIAMLFLPLMTERKAIDWIVTAITIVLTLLAGARGPFLIIVFLIVVGLFVSGSRTKGKYILYSLTIALSLVIYKNLTKILTYIAANYGNGTSLRNINRILNGSFFSDMWRPRIYSFVLDYINNHIFIGSGLFNDRIIINREFSNLGEAIGSYPHNFFLEICMQFGAVLGVIMCIVFLSTLFKRFINTDLIEEKYLMTAFVFSGFLPLMVSGSYLSYPMFYALLGFCNSSFINIGRK